MADTPTRPTWLVTGATGFLGANIGAFLDGRAHRIGSARTEITGDELYDEYLTGDLEHPETLVAAIEARRPDVVIHAAALASHEACEADPARAEQINAHAAGALSNAAARCGTRFVLISTDAVFDGERGNYTETDEPHPTTVYGRTKLMGEQLVAENPDALIVRTNFFGWSPSGSRSILEFFVNELSAGRPVRGFTDFTTTSAYAQVLADVIWRLVQGDATGTFHVTSPDALTKHDFGIAVAQAFGLPTDLIAPSTADVHPPRGRDLSLDVAKVQAWLGEALPSQLDGIARALADSATLRPALANTLGN
jgi:dTDP-4-dehydrorhamnose reductase